MNKKGIKIFCLVMVFALLFACTPFAFATSSEIKDKQDDLSDVNQQITDTQNNINSNNTKISTLTKEINTLEKKINTTQTKIDNLTSSINSTKSQITQKLAELEDMENNIQGQNSDINARLRAMYKNGNAGMLSVLFHSTSLSNLLTNIEMAKRLYAADANLLLKMHSQYDAIYEAKVELTELKDSLTTQQEDLESTKDELESDEADLATKKKQVQSDNKELEAQLDALNEEADALIKEIRTLQLGGDYAGGTMCWPSRASTRITEYYGMRLHPILKVNKLHTGIDIGAAKGTDILAANSGTVIAAGYKPASYGYYVMIDHGGNVVTLYGHASKLLVSKGDVVSRGQVIALVGTTGMSTGNHIHFEIRINGAYQDPLDKTALYYVEPGVYYFD